jgi:hypothetical protein
MKVFQASILNLLGSYAFFVSLCKPNENLDAERNKDLQFIGRPRATTTRDPVRL